MSDYTHSWQASRSGSHAGRGFRYQDAVGAHLAIAAWRREIAIEEIVPEGLDDFELRTPNSTVRVQVKSRRTSLGPFPISDIAKHVIALARRSGSQDELVLVIEHPPAGAPPTSWNDSVSAIPSLADAVSPLLERSEDRREPVADLLARTKVIVIPDAPIDEMRAISAELDLPTAACAAHYSAIRHRIGQLADANGLEGQETRQALGVTELQRIVDEVTEYIDIEALDDAVARGVCEVVDFATGADDLSFYVGRDATPGDIAAGFAVPRPEIEAEIERALETGGRALVVGPSGCGKSALLWRICYASRHRRVWYRVRRLETDDVPSLVRLAKSRVPSPDAPFGFVVDDLGQRGTAGWDNFTKETRLIPGVLVLGAAREEDAILLQTASDTYQAHPRLDEPLAQRLHSELARRRATDWEHWVEPFHQSHGLLLEYGHILTTGKRLESVLRGQVDVRIRDGRLDELSILRMVCTAHRFGARLTLDSLAQALNNNREALTLPLRRLVDEHLVRVGRGEVLSGTHQIRSQALSQLLHQLTPWTLAETFAQLIAILSARDLQVFAARTLREHWDSVDGIVDAVASRVRSEPDLSILASALHALRLASFERQARAWVDAVEDDVPPSRMDVTLSFAIADLSAPREFIPEIRRALTKLRRISVEDVRIRLIRALSPSEFANVLASPATPDETAAFLAALSGCAGVPDDLVGQAAGRAASATSVDALAELIDAARAVSPDAARSAVEAAGGEGAVAERIEREVPWVTQVTHTNPKIISADIAYVFPRLQPDPHADVVRLCQLLLWSLNSVERAKCAAISPAGGLAGYKGVPLADKTLRRSVVPSPAIVAWNRARMRIASNIISVNRATRRLAIERQLIPPLANSLSRIGSRWCRGERPEPNDVQCLASIANDAADLPPFPIEMDEHYGPMAQGTVASNDPFTLLVDALAKNFVPRLYEARANLLALFVVLSKALEELDTVSDPRRWALLGTVPEECVELGGALADLRAVLGETHHGGSAFKSRLRARAKREPDNALRACADLAREAAQSRMSKYSRRIVRELKQRRLTAHVFTKLPEKESDWVWPAEEVLVGVHVDNIFQWQGQLPKVVSICRKAFPDNRSIDIAPIREDSLVTSQGGRVVQHYFPLPDSAAAWTGHVPFHPLEESAGDAFRNAVESLTEQAGIIWLRSNWRRTLHEKERQALHESASQLAIARQELMNLLEGPSPDLLGEALEFVDNLHGLVTEENDALHDGHVLDEYVAPLLWSAMTERPAELVGMAAVLQLALVEWDANPTTATTNVEEGIRLLEGLPNSH